MSISLGIYDLFAYLIPGLLYLFVYNEFSKVVGWNFFDTSLWLQGGQSPSTNLIIPILLFSYLVGHVMESVAHSFFFNSIYFLRIRRFQKVSSSVLQTLTNKYPSLKIKFSPEDWDVLFSLLRKRNIETAHVIDKFQADTIMLRNIGFGLFLLFLIQLVNFILSSELPFVFASLGSLLLSIVSFNRSAHFREWFFIEIFKSSLGYGKSLKEVIEYKNLEK